MKAIELEDQFGRLHVYTFPADTPVVLFAADRKGNERLDPWIQSVSEVLGKRVTCLGVADVRGVPGLLRGKVKRGFREARDHPVLMDWKGELLDEIQPEKDVPNVYLISRLGVVVAHSSGEASSERVHAFLDRVASLLGSTAPEAVRKGTDGPLAVEEATPVSAARKPDQ
ncbi:MAG: hypothetical protein MUC91_14385 [Verrucomicrobia bacterium]|nr:hypothetical protein [Verrucomicrobiota bacterium]